MPKFVYFFGGGKAEGHRDMKDALGGKGAGLAEMTNAGLPVPPGFTMSTKACAVVEENKGALTPQIEDEIAEALAKEGTNVTLNGFGAAYDGPGMKQSELEEQNKKLQDELAKRKKEFEDKLKAEQEQAPAAGNGG